MEALPIIICVSKLLTQKDHNFELRAKVKLVRNALSPRTKALSTRLYQLTPRGTHSLQIITTASYIYNQEITN